MVARRCILVSVVLGLLGLPEEVRVRSQHMAARANRTTFRDSLAHQDSRQKQMQSREFSHNSVCLAKRQNYQLVARIERESSSLTSHEERPGLRVRSNVRLVGRPYSSATQGRRTETAEGRRTDSLRLRAPCSPALRSHPLEPDPSEFIDRTIHTAIENN